MNNKDKTILMLMIVCIILAALVTGLVVDVEKLQQRVSAIEISNLSKVSKQDIQDITKAASVDRQAVQLLRNDFENWQGMWNELFEGRK